MIFAADKPAVLPVAGMLLLLFSMAFKVSAAPFHFWTPDVYDGAPTVFTSFMATIVKAAVFIAFIRLFDETFGFFHAAMANYGCRYYSCYIIYWKYHGRFSAKRKTNAGLFKYCAGRIYVAGSIMP